MSGSGGETLPDVWKAFRMSERPRGSLGVFGRPFRMFGSVREALPDVWEWTGGPSGCPGVVGSPSWMSRSVQKAHPHAQEALSDVR